MILLFDSKPSRSTSSANKNSNVKNHPVENSGILAMSLGEAKSVMTMGEYDSYVASNPVAVNYAMYSDFGSDYSADGGFMSEFSSAVAFLGDSGFSTGSYDCGSFSSYAGGGSSYSGASCGSFASVC